jgi:hypothetical protein
MKLIVRKTSIFALLAVTLIFGSFSENASAACSVIKAAHCFCSGGGATFTNTSPECYNQQTQNAACAADCKGACNQRGTFYNAIKAARTNAGGPGGCGNVAVTILGHAGTRSDENGGTCMVDTGGTWIAAVAASCPQGGTLIGSSCVIKVAITKTCPAGWSANQTNVVGGVTADGICKKPVAGCSLPAPLPANGTQIGTSGSYGFTWGNSVVVFGNAGNGGAAVSSCPQGYAIVGTMCQKSYPATAGTAAYCKR